MKLVIQSGADAGQEFPVTERTTIGRSSQNSVVLHDTYVGRTHAEIRQGAEGYVIVDLNSRNGTLVNDARITAPHVLRPGDRIKIGETVAVVAEGTAAPVRAEMPPPAAAPQRNLLPVIVPVAALLVLILAFALSRGTGIPAVTPTAVVVPTNTTFIAVLPTSTPVPTRTALPPGFTPPPAALCANPNLRITSPADGAEIRGVVDVYGTAAIVDFSFYKLEYGVGPIPSAWTIIGEVVPTPARDARLAIWDTTVLPAGEYVLRLTAVDKTGNYPAPCELTLRIRN